MSIIDPTTGDVRPAGEYTRSEWEQMVRERPDLASLILELRRRENEIEDLKQNDGLPLAMTGLTAGVAFPYAYRAMPRLGTEFAHRWQQWGDQSYGLEEPLEIFRGNRVSLTIDPADGRPAGGQMNLRVDGSLEKPYNPVFDPNDLLKKSGEPYSERYLPKRKQSLIDEGRFKKEFQEIPNRMEVGRDLQDARLAMAGHLANKKDGRKLFVMAPSEDGMFSDKAGRKRLFDMGFQPGTLGGQDVWMLDNRPGAGLLGQGYHLVDNVLAKYATGGKVRGLRFAGALLGALGLGHAVGSGIGFLDERV